MKRILIVDDDSRAVEGLRHRLESRTQEWTVRFAPSAHSALDELARHPQDVIVSEVRAPEIDGLELFRSVGERWPDTIRIALAASADTSENLRLLPLAHQYVSKPCRPQHLENVIERCLKLRATLSQPPLRALIGRVSRLPARPRIFARLQVVMSNPNATAGDVARIVMADAAITAKVLQLANSAYTRRARRVTSIEQAVLHLGFFGVRNLVMCAEVFARWPTHLAHAALDLELMQRHAQRVAAVAHALTAGSACADDAVLAALLHDIGYWLIVQECPRELERALELAILDSMPLHAAEMQVLGASHAELGAYLLGLWGLPYAVVEAVAHHHEHGRARGTQFDALAALAVASALAGTDDTDAFVSSPLRAAIVGPEFLRDLNAPFSWTQAEQRAVDCLSELEREASG